MCGILCIHNLPGNAAAFRSKALRMSRALRHRGPDWSGCVVAGQTICCHERLAIVGIASGAQPIRSADGKLILTVNGEIYNYRTLQKTVRKSADVIYTTESDCEVILHLYTLFDTKLCSMLDGIFSFTLLDTSVTPPRLIAARDPIGVTPLYQGFSSKLPGAVFFASELKALDKECDSIMAFPPGCLWDSKTGEFEQYFKPSWWSGDASVGHVIPSQRTDLLLQIRLKLEEAVRKRLMTEVPFGVLLSGGLDSSLIASIAVREVQAHNSPMRDEERVSTASTSASSMGLFEADGQRQIQSFSIGLKGAPDLIAAREVAEFLGTAHHECVFTVEEGIDALADVIYYLETYDVTTVRASTPMYLLSRRIKAAGVKMVLSGEGSDEVFGGYLYFHAAPTPAAFHRECVTRVKNLHTSDCLRANKSTMAWGVEARVPFLDQEFLELTMNIRPEDKMFSSKKGCGEKEKGAHKGWKIEKQILREAFDTNAWSATQTSADGKKQLSVKPYLPDSVLWRQKEQFSDGVGYSWIDGLKEHVEKVVSDEEFARRAALWPNDDETALPSTKEAFYYRKLFDSWFSPSCAKTVVRWSPKTEWGAGADPSGRAQTVHVAAYDTNGPVVASTA